MTLAPSKICCSSDSTNIYLYGADDRERNSRTLSLIKFIVQILRILTFLITLGQILIDLNMIVVFSLMAGYFGGNNVFEFERFVSLI